MEDVWKGTETLEREGLDNMDWTSGHSDCKAGRDEKSKSVEEVEGNGGENWYGRGGGWNWAERAGESVCYNVFRTRNVDYIAGELGDVG